MDGYNLNLQSYCSYCKDFSPKLDQIDISGLGDRNKYMNNISCRNKEKCEHIAETLRGKV